MLHIQIIIISLNKISYNKNLSIIFNYNNSLKKLIRKYVIIKDKREREERER